MGMPRRDGSPSFLMRRAWAGVGLAALLLIAGAAGAQGTDDATRRLLEAARAGDLGKAQVALAQGADIGARDAAGLTAPDIAVERGHYDLAHFLLAHRKHLASRTAPDIPPPPVPREALPEATYMEDIPASAEAVAPQAPQPPPAPPPAVVPPAVVSHGSDPFDPSAPIAGGGLSQAGPVVPPTASPAAPVEPPTATPAEPEPPVPSAEDERSLMEHLGDMFSGETDTPEPSAQAASEAPQVPEAETEAQPETVPDSVAPQETGESQEPDLLEQLADFFSGRDDTPEAVDEAAPISEAESPSVPDPAPVETAEAVTPPPPAPETAAPALQADPEPIPVPEPEPVAPPPPPRPAPVASWLSNPANPFEPAEPLPAHIEAGEPQEPLLARRPEMPPASTVEDTTPSPEDLAEDTPQAPTVAESLAQAAPPEPPLAEGQEPDLFERLSDFFRGNATDDATGAASEDATPSPDSLTEIPAPREPLSMEELAQAETPETSISDVAEPDLLDRLSDFFSRHGTEKEATEPETKTAKAEPDTPAPPAEEPPVPVITKRGEGPVSLATAPPSTAETAPPPRPAPVAAWTHGTEQPFEPTSPVATAALPDPESVPQPAPLPKKPLEWRSSKPQVLPDTPQATQAPLRDITLVLGETVGLGRTRTAESLERDCLRKRTWEGTYCTESVDWPKPMQKLFGVHTQLYSGTKAVARYDRGKVTRYHVQFPAFAFDGVTEHLMLKFGPPTDAPPPRRVWTGPKRPLNPRLIWEVRGDDGKPLAFLEIRKYDDLSGTFPDSRFGCLQLYEADAPRIFRELAPVDLAIDSLRRSRLPRP